MNAVIYARYSSDNQREESIEGQLRDCREYAEQNKLAIVGNYIDRALSARTADRPDFQRMIHDSEKRLFDVVLVWKLDRFSRDRYDSAHYKHILKKNGVRVISAKEAIADGPEGIILESMLEGMAEYYSAELAVKVRRGQRENAMKCRNNGGTLAYGYSVNKETGALVVNPKTAPIVREIFSRYDKGELIKSIIKDLNARGLRNNFNRPFQASAMTLLLKNRKYIGDYCYGDTIIPGGVPALVEKDVFERVQRRMEANKKSPGRAKAKEEYLLSGKVFCGTCGGHMVGECGKSRNGTFYYYYKCINAKHGHTCKRKALKRDWLERAVVVETVTKVLTDEIIDRVADAIIAIQGQENPMIPSIKEQLRVCDKGLKNLLKAIEASIFTPTTKERMEELERQKEELNISLIRAQMAQPVFTKEEIVKWISRFKYGSINDKAYQREIIDTFLNSVYVYDDKILFTYNFRDHAETVTLDEIEYLFCSDVNDGPPPIPHQFWCGISWLYVNSWGRDKSKIIFCRHTFIHPPHQAPGEQADDSGEQPEFHRDRRSPAILHGAPLLPPIQGEVRHHPHGVRPVRTISAAAFRCAGRHKSAMQKNLRCCPIRAEAQASLLPNHRRAACVEDGYFVCFAAYSPASVSCFCRLPF